MIEEKKITISQMKKHLDNKKIFDFHDKSIFGSRFGTSHLSLYIAMSRESPCIERVEWE